MRLNFISTVPIKGKDDRPVADLFLLEVTDMFFADSVLDPETLHIDAIDFDPLARLAGPTYGKLDGLFDMIRPR
nr:hypothetical protein [Secundilactobacillus folii]